MDSLVSEIGDRYGADLTEMARIEELLGNVKLRDELISHIGEMVRCRKLCERVKAEQNKDIAYHVHIVITGTMTRIRVARDGIMP